MESYWTGLKFVRLILLTKEYVMGSYWSGFRNSFAYLDNYEEHDIVVLDER